jgi:PAS domain S-box-containing protein
MRGKLATVALRTSLLYALIAGIWILISDKVVVAFFSDPTVIGQISMYKGWAFVATTALLLYLALRADLRRWETEAMERKRAEDALASEVDMRRALFARSPDGVLIIDPETARPIEFNDAAHRQLGYTREEFARLSIFDLEAVETPEETRTRIQGVFREGRADFETRHRTKQGELRNVHVTAQVIKVQGREVYHCIWRDITERKRAEAAVRKSEERYRRLFEANPHPMWLYDVQTLAFLEVNDAAVTHYGFSREEFLGMTIADIRPAEDVPRLLVNIAHVGERCVDEAGTWRHRRKDGSIIWVEITSHVLEYLGHPAELVLAHDVTERLRAEAALRAGEERLNRILETIPDGIAIVNL